MPLAQRKARPEKTPVADSADKGLLWITLTQTEGEDIRFRGAYVAEATSYTPNAPVWHTITLYRRGASGCVSYVVSIRIYQKTLGIEDKARVFTVATIDAVMDLVENYRPEADVQTPLSANAVKQLSPVQAALHTAKLQRDISQVRRYYDAMVGNFLFTIGALKPF
jgi:hypothetical protein